MARYGAAVQWLLTLVVPLAFVNFYPASLLLEQDAGVLARAAWLVVPLLGPCVLLAAHRLLRAGVSVYEGARQLRNVLQLSVGRRRGAPSGKGRSVG